jgi:NitT/TauT family transport system permease protein
MAEPSTPRLIAPPSRARRAWLAAQGVVVPVATLLVLVALWEAGTRAFQVPAFLLPAPSRIWSELQGIAPHLPGNILATLSTVLLGFAASIAVALPLAVAIASSATIARATYPLLLVTQSTPIVAIAPILVVVLGTGQLSRMTVAFLIAFFPLLVSTVTGLLSVPKDMTDLSRAMRTSFWQDLWLIRLPSAVPFIFAGLKVAISLSVIGAVVAEFVSANAGLGYLITQSTAFFNVPVAFGAVVLLAMMGVALFGLVVLAERLLFPWAAGASRRS